MSATGAGTRQTPVVFNLPEPDRNQLSPSALNDIPNSGGFRLEESVTVSFYTLPEAELRNLFDARGVDAAIGAVEIWHKFPEQRGLFVAEINRPNGSRNQRTNPSYRHLRECIIGDNLTSETLHFPGSTQIGFSSKHVPDIIDSFDATHLSIGHFEFLRKSTQTVALSNKDDYELFCVSQFSTDIPENTFSALGLFLYSQCYLNDLEGLVRRKEGLFHEPSDFPELRFNLENVIPPRSSFFFFFDESAQGSSEFKLALVNRLLAAAALCGCPHGRTATRWRSGKGSNYTFESYELSAQSRRFFQRQPFRSYHISHINQKFSDCLSLIRKSDHRGFALGKEDFRLRALDTVEDSGRSGVLALTILQIWMAIECLISEKQETTQSLSLALSSFFCADQRAVEFGRIKKAYAFRSSVAHGYAFPRDDIYQQLEFIAPLFQRVFLSSLRFQSGDEFKLALRDHVLRAEALPFDS